MVFSRYRFFIVIQILLIALTTLAFFWTINQEYMLITSSSLVVFWILQIIYLIWYLQKINRDLLKFITALRYNDVSISFNKDKKVDKNFKNLYEELNNIITEISEIRSEKESEQQYFQNVVKHIGIGILAFENSGKIEICNNALLQLLNINSIQNLIDVDTIMSGFSKNLQQIKPGTTKLIKLLINNEIVQLSIKATNLKIRNKNIKLLSLQNIKAEIERSEVDAWQKLIRILTHEIMNSVSPIKILSGSLVNMYEENDKIKSVKEIDDAIIENSVLGLKTIHKRSTGLSNFVETYKNATQIPKPNFTEFNIYQLLDHISSLLQHDFSQNNIELIINCTPHDIFITADEKLLEQVLINLVKNSIHALAKTEKPIIKITASQINNQVQIIVLDNGKGISTEVLDNIFIPFFTTKEKGSGIGLSLSRQIMHLHGGNISVKSEPNVSTTFTLQF